MGDGIEPYITGAITAVASGIVGIVHGGLDSSVEMPGFSHELMNYAPAGLSALATATSEYGLKGQNERIGAGVISAGVSGAATGVGYLIGRILVAGYKSVTG